jgi:hypothetical protein
MADDDYVYTCEIELTQDDLSHLLELLHAAERMAFVISGIHSDDKLGELRHTLQVAYHQLLDRNSSGTVVKIP